MSLESSELLNPLENINYHFKYVKLHMIIHLIVTIINIFLTILSISLHITDDYTHDHIVMFIFTSLMTFINFCFDYYSYKKLDPIIKIGLIDAGSAKTTLNDIFCVGFYNSVINGIWLIVSIVMESIIISDNINNEEQGFLISELIIVIFVSFYNIVTTCKICLRSYNDSENINYTMSNFINGGRQNQIDDI